MERLKVEQNITISEKFLRQIEESIFENEVAYKYCKKLGLSDDQIRENAPKIFDFSEDVKNCKNCKGLKYCNKTPKYLVTNITYEEGVVDRNILPCKKYLEQVNFKKRFVVVDFSEDFYDVLLEDISNKNTKAKKAVMQVYKETALLKKSNKWIYMKGDMSTGKSFFAATLCVHAAKEKAYDSISYIDVPERFKELTDLAFQKSPRFNDLLDSIKNSEMLVLDDFGNEFKSDFVRENILFPILSYRGKNKLFTIITSNYAINDICTMYQTNVASKPKIEQIKQLLQIMCGEEITLPSLLAQ